VPASLEPGRQPDARSRGRLADPALDAVRTALERILEGHLPYPAVITDRLGDLVSGNRAFWALADGAATWRWPSCA
jgi:MmyB-like transcription regulator ligand binding domain